MPTHIVQQGECLSSIAKKHGISNWRTIYDHQQNAEFKKQRPNPNVIFPGDRLFIPETDGKSEERGTEGKHTFQLDLQKTRIRLKLKNEEGQAFSGKKYKLVIGGVIHEGTTSGEALIEHEISSDADSGQLTVWLDNDTSRPGFTWNLKIGHLDPAEEVSGIQARLKNLGYNCGPVDGIVGPKTRAALKGFQSVNGLSETGEIDEATREQLKQLHDEG